MIDLRGLSRTGLSQLGWRAIVLRLLFALSVIAAIAFFARDAGKEIVALESWIAGKGLMGAFVFLVAAVLLMAVFAPSSLIGAFAGALYGLLWGTVVVAASGLLTAALTYLVSRGLLQKRISKFLEVHPKLLAIQRAVQQGGLRLQLMLRLAPINAVSVNYVLGAAGVRFPPFIIAAFGIIPGFFLEVYFGHLAKHVSKVSANVGGHSTVETVVTVVGFLCCVGVMLYIGRAAKKALAEAGALE